MHYYSFVDHEMNRDALCLKVKKEATGQDILFVGMYMPPEGSQYVNSDAFSELEETLLLMQSKSIMGDLNARIGLI